MEATRYAASDLVAEVPRLDRFQHLKLFCAFLSELVLSCRRRFLGNVSGAHKRSWMGVAR